MRSLVLALTILIGSSPVSADMLKTPFFLLNLPGDWKQEADADPNNYTLTSKKYRATATISAYEWNPPDLEKAAHSLVNIRHKAEVEVLAKAGRKAEISESVKKRPFGFQMEYFGIDSQRRRFRYWGIAAPTKNINIYIEANQLSEEEMSILFRELLSGLKT